MVAALIGHRLGVRGRHWVGLIAAMRHVGRRSPREGMTRVHYLNGDEVLWRRASKLTAFDDGVLDCGRREAEALC
jgi:hypothetical protein